MSVIDQTDKVPVNRTQKRTQSTRKRLLQSALALFVERGIERATIEQITERADLGKGTFYKHFNSKADVVLALLQAAVARLLGHIRESAAQARDAHSALDSLVQAHRAYSIDNAGEFILFFHGQLFLQLQKDDVAALDAPFAGYLEEIERCLSTFLPVTPAGVRRFTAALVGFVTGLHSFAMLGLSEPEIQKYFASLQLVFVNEAAMALSVRGKGELPAAADSALAPVVSERR